MAQENMSKNHPAFARGVVSVTGSQVVNTGLREVVGATANIKADAAVADEEGVVLVNWGKSLEPGQIRIAVYKGGSASGTIGDSAVDVSFMAEGDR